MGSLTLKLDASMLIGMVVGEVRVARDEAGELCLEICEVSRTRCDIEVGFDSDGQLEVQRINGRPGPA